MEPLLSDASPRTRPHDDSSHPVVSTYMYAQNRIEKAADDGGCFRFETSEARSAAVPNLMSGFGDTQVRARWEGGRDW